MYFLYQTRNAIFSYHKMAYVRGFFSWSWKRPTHLQKPPSRINMAQTARNTRSPFSFDSHCVNLDLSIHPSIASIRYIFSFFFLFSVWYILMCVLVCIVSGGPRITRISQKHSNTPQIKNEFLTLINIVERVSILYALCMAEWVVKKKKTERKKRQLFRIGFFLVFCVRGKCTENFWPKG